MAAPILRNSSDEQFVDLRRAGSMAPVVPTGKTLVQFAKGSSASDVSRLLSVKSGAVASTQDFRSSFDFEAILNSGNTFFLDRLGVAIVQDEHSDFAVRHKDLESRSGIVRAMRDFYLFAYGGRVTSRSPDEDDGEGVHEDGDDATWGVQSVGADRCAHTGRGIKIAVLDTGFDLAHPDFAERDVECWSALPEPVFPDLQGHGTHVAGTAAGYCATSGMRYGVACEASLRIYKVLNNAGVGSDSSVLAGINQALSDGCEIISMSFGRGATAEGKPHPLFQNAGLEALNSGSILIAAAGNSSSRDLSYVAPIDYPANSPSIMAVAAIDSKLRVANYSSGAVWKGSQIDMTAPGSGIFSAFPMPRRYRRWWGTSMAAPHVAGVAALWAQVDESFRGAHLWEILQRNAKPLFLETKDMGPGLVQVPGLDRY